MLTLTCSLDEPHLQMITKGDIRSAAKSQHKLKRVGEAECYQHTAHFMSLKCSSWYL